MPDWSLIVINHAIAMSWVFMWRNFIFPNLKATINWILAFLYHHRLSLVRLYFWKKEQCGSFSNFYINLDSDHKHYIQSQGFNHWQFWQHLEYSRYLILCANRKHYPAIVRPPVNRFMEMLKEEICFNIFIL